MKKVLLYEDNRDLAESIAFYLGLNDQYQLVAHFENPTDVLLDIKLHQPDILLMDIDMPKMNGIEATKVIRKNGIATPVLMLTVFEDDQNIIDAICSGANGYILKGNLDGLEAHMIDAQNGGAPLTGSIATRVLKLFAERKQPAEEHIDFLTEREKEVLQLLSKGHSYKMIASDLFLSIDTIRVHIRKIYQKLGVNSATEALNKVYVR